MKSPFLNLIIKSSEEWINDNVPKLAAATAFFTAFSIAPLLVIVIGFTSIFLGKQAAQGQIVNEIGGLIGTGAAQFIQFTIQSASLKGHGVLATVLGFVFLIFGATGVFAEIQNDFDIIWHVKPRPEKGVSSFIRARLLSFGMIFVLGFLLLVSLVVSASLVSFANYTRTLFPGAETLLNIANVLVSIVVVTILFALIFKYLPDVIIHWRDVWIGSLVTALLFTIGKFLIGLYLGSSSITSSYGAAGSLVILLLWVYYSSQILYFGAEFTRVQAKMRGSEIKPARHAEWM